MQAHPSSADPIANDPIAKDLDPVGILAVIVLYGQGPEESATLRTLLVSAGRLTPAAGNLHILLYDNSPVPAGAFVAADGRLSYCTASANGGLAAGYNEALRRAEAAGCRWLLTLDQDTELPPDFLPTISRLAARLKDREEVAVIAPHLVDGARLLSPVRVHFCTHRALPVTMDGVLKGEVRALNSAALLRVSALRELGGFHPLFWLNYLDDWLHHALYRRGKRMWVAGELVIQHELSLLDYRGRMTLAHYSDFLLAESAFRDLYRGSLANAAYTAQLLLRWMNQRRRREKPEILAATRGALLRRLTRSRKYRIADWTAQMEQRLKPREA